MPSATPQPPPEARRRLLRLAGFLYPHGRSKPASSSTFALPPVDANRPVRRLLLIRPDHIGDLLLTSPAIALLRRALPSVELTYLVGPWSAEVARHGPPVDRLETLDFPGFTRRPKANLVAPYLVLAREAARLRAARYDAAIILRPDHWWGALLALSAGIRTRIGFDLPDTHPLLTHALQSRPIEHAAEQTISLARFAAEVLGGSGTHGDVCNPVFRLHDTDIAGATRLLGAHRLAERPLVAVQPGAGAELKSWPTSRWASLADGLGKLGYSVVLVGGPDDGALLEEVARQAQGSIPMLYGQSLAVTAAIYSASDLVVGVDGGGPHLAGAVGTPTLRLYGPAPPAAFGPWPARDDQRVLIAERLVRCAPCGVLEAPPCGATRLPVCMLAVSVQNVLETARRMLERNQENTSA